VAVIAVEGPVDMDSWEIIPIQIQWMNLRLMNFLEM
jgi:hypothetical protein